MSSSADAPLRLLPLFEGAPVLLRLTTGQDLIAVVFQADDEEDDDIESIGVRVILQRPVIATVRAILPSVGDQTTETVKLALEPWMPLSSSSMFPIYTDHVLCIAPLVPAAEEEYDIVAQSFYGDVTDNDPDTPEDVQKSYHDFLFHNFTHKGKPN